MKRKIN